MRVRVRRRILPRLTPAQDAAMEALLRSDAGQQALALVEALDHPEWPRELTPSPGGRECLGNGSWPGYECQCDECDDFLTCYPEYDTP